MVFIEIQSVHYVSKNIVLLIVSYKIKENREITFFQILVTINFRQGPLGFMSTANDDLPANLGLWDQNFALKWVQSNIKDFGGDPNKVS